MKDKPSDPPFKIPYETVVEAIGMEIKNAKEIDEELLINCMKYEGIDRKDIDLFLELLLERK